MEYARIVRSFEEFLYEVMTWLVLYPLTFWRIAVKPTSMVVAELPPPPPPPAPGSPPPPPPADPYLNRLSPPLMLFLTILVTHAFELGSGGFVLPKSKTGPDLGTEPNVLAMRVLFFAIFPMVLALVTLRRRKVLVDRNSLRAPFYSQCYLVVPFVFAEQLAGTLARSPWGSAAVVAACALGVGGAAWYLAVQTLWFRHQLGMRLGSAIGTALLGILAGTVACLTTVTVVVVVSFL